MLKTSFNIVSVLLILALPPRQGVAADETKDLSARYQPALERLAQRFSNFTATATHERIDYTASVKYFRKGNSFQSWQTYDVDAEKRPPKYPLIHVRSENEANKFELSKWSSSGDFTLTGFGPLKKEQLTRYHRRYNKTIALAAFHVFDISMLDLMAHEGSTLVSGATKLSPSGEKLVEFVFDVDERLSSFQTVHVDLLPDRDWIIDSYGVEFSHDYGKGVEIAEYAGKIEYELDGIAGYEVPESILIEVNQGGSDPILVVGASIDYDFSGSVTDNQFTLENFGLGSEESHPGPLKLFFLINFIVVAAFVIIFFLIRRRKVRSDD